MTDKEKAQAWDEIMRLHREQPDDCHCLAMCDLANMTDHERRMYYFKNTAERAEQEITSWPDWKQKLVGKDPNSSV